MKFHAEESKKLSEIALGGEAADLLLKNCTIVNVYSGEIVKGQQIAIGGERIAYVGASDDLASSRVIDVADKVVIPGLIDGHLHMDVWLKPEEVMRLSLPRGTTTLVTECSAVANALGVEGIKIFLQQTGKMLQRVFVAAPTIAYLCSDSGGDRGAVSLEDMLEILNFPEIVALGEIYWPNLLNENRKEIHHLIAACITQGKVVSGHGAGARNQRLAAQAAAGVSSCHEPITAEEVRDRLRLGMHAMIREGSIRRELAKVIRPLTAMGMDLRRACLVSDGAWPDFLANLGHMDFILQQAIDLGLDPVNAIQMATLNAAEYFGLDDRLGGIAPGKFADLVVIPSLNQIKAEVVICRGQIAAEKGKLAVEEVRTSFPAEAANTIRLPRLYPENFQVAAAESDAVAVRVIEMQTDIVNKESIVNLPVRGGYVALPEGQDILKAAVIDRYHENGEKSIGFIKGFGLRSGAVASSFSFDEGNLVIIGTNEEDMAAVANRIRELQGGLVFCSEGEVRAEMAMPYFGSISDYGGEEAARRIKDFETQLQQAGCSGARPLLTIFTTTFTAIPSIRLLARGYWLAKERKFVSLFA